MDKLNVELQKRVYIYFIVGNTSDSSSARLVDAISVKEIRLTCEH